MEPRPNELRHTKPVYGLLSTNKVSICLYIRNSMLTLVLSHSLNSLMTKTNGVFFLVVPYSKNILHYQFY